MFYGMCHKLREGVKYNEGGNLKMHMNFSLLKLLYCMSQAKYCLAPNDPKIIISDPPNSPPLSKNSNLISTEIPEKS